MEGASWYQNDRAVRPVEKKNDDDDDDGFGTKFNAGDDGAPSVDRLSGLFYLYHG